MHHICTTFAAGTFAADKMVQSGDIFSVRMINFVIFYPLYIFASARKLLLRPVYYLIKYSSIVIYDSRVSVTRNLRILRL